MQWGELLQIIGFLFLLGFGVSVFAMAVSLIGIAIMDRWFK
jgi:hypothetical protein